MAEKPVKVKETPKAKTAGEAKPKPAKAEAVKAAPAKAASPFKALMPVKAAEKGKEKTQPKQPNRVVRWWRETLGELRKVSWPTVPEARRMTVIVLAVMAVTALVLGLLDFIFSRFIGLLVSL